MTEVWQSIVRAAAALSWWEVAAVLLAVSYLLLAIRQNLACWPAAIASAAIYTVLMYQAGLYMESALQFFYIGMAFYGWWHWSAGGSRDSELLVTDWPLAFHALPILAIVTLSIASGYALDSFSAAAFPYMDSFTTWGAIVTTWMVARKVLQNWYYWFVIDGVSVYLYTQRGLHLTALLFVFYLVLIVIGYRAWRRTLRVQYG